LRRDRDELRQLLAEQEAEHRQQLDQAQEDR
jgi:hypothetical protein